MRRIPRVNRRWRRATAPLSTAVAVALLACACGSTVQSTGSIQSGDAGLPGLSSGTPAQGTTSAGGGGTSGLSPSGGTDGSGQVTAAGSANDPALGTADGGAAAQGGTNAPKQVAATSQPVKVGFMYSTDTNAALAAMGAKQGTGDGKQLTQAVIDYVNKTGGIAGHKIVPAYYNVSATDSPQAISQGACTQWTQDDHVFAAVPLASVQDNDVMRSCLAHARTPAVYPNFYTETTEDAFTHSPLWFELEGLSVEKWAQVYAAGLAQMGFFHNTKIGLVYDDGPTFTGVVNRVLLPALRHYGADVVATARESIHGVNDLGSGNSQMSNAVLNFQTKGVTNVMFFEVWQGWFLFLQNAQSQHWYPKYGLSTQNALQIMIDLGLVPTGELPGSVVVGWNPGVDVPLPSSGGWPRLQLCRDIFRKAGQDITGSGQEAYHGGLSLCESILALQDAGRLAAAPLSTSSLAAGLAALGHRLQLGNLPSGDLEPNRHYAAVQWRPGKYDGGCGCGVYTGQAQQIR